MSKHPNKPAAPAQGDEQAQASQAAEAAPAVNLEEAHAANIAEAVANGHAFRITPSGALRVDL